MLIILRIILGAALIYVVAQAVQSAPSTHGAGDTTGAAYLAVCVILGLLNAIVWAPYLGEKISGPIAGTITNSTYVERLNPVLRLIQWLDSRGKSRPTRWLCFLEGIRHPSMPTAFVLGLKHAKPGSWLEKVYAREVYRFNNVQNCVHASAVLKAHGIDPGPHSSQSVNMVLMSTDRAERPEPRNLAVPPPTEPPPLKRNPGIKTFKS
jgi:hypothetical protein